ncbi:RNA polymerase sigma factor [Ornithinimicrobium sp. Y1847]|uniref:RNA polymerase sigma factor n=1 Tax=Ornithinimicrobium sp. Y1847 TaxID=3405419 RepID=UPI003B67068C
MSPPTSSRSAPGPPAGSEDRFRRLYADVRDDVQRFVLRRCDPAEADDVVAETFTTVWRRIADLPDHLGDQRAWVYGIARGCLSNVRRSRARRTALAVRIAEVPPRSASNEPADAAALLDLRRAWSRLSPRHQEAIALTAWDDLTSDQAGHVLGISATAYRARLARARSALRSHLEDSDCTTTHTSLTRLERSLP